MPRATNQIVAALARELRERGYDRVRVRGDRVRVGRVRGDYNFTLTSDGTTLFLFNGSRTTFRKKDEVAGQWVRCCLTRVDLADPCSLQRLLQTIDAHYPLGR